MEKNLKKKEFLEADKMPAESVLPGLQFSKDGAHLVKPFSDWLIDINEQLAAFPQ